MEFKAYQHIEKFGRDEVLDINLGTCHVFPKIDGTNASVWYNREKTICCGSRRREISLEADNGGFMKYIITDDNAAGIRQFLLSYPDFRLFGEWLIPHTLKTYKFDAWKKFYVFDVCRDTGDETEDMEYMPYESYALLMEEFGIDYIPCIAVIKSGDYEAFVKQLQNNVFLIEDGEGTGEGIVIKNYDFYNRFGRQTWAKIVASDFKERHGKTMGPAAMKGPDMIEEKIALELNKDTVDKVIASITEGKGVLEGKDIPRLLDTVWHDFITEEIWHILKKFKTPRIDFKVLHRFVVNRIKKLVPEVF